MSSPIVEQYNTLHNHYKIFNLVNKYKKVIFILESPHVDELIHKSPVSGLSGKAMSKVLLDGETTPIGITLKQRPEHKFGIMNVCNIPMQRSAYQDSEVVSSYGNFPEEPYTNFFDAIEKIRTAPKKMYKEEDKNALQEAILGDFKKELQKLKERELVLIPCGKTAEKFFALAGVSSPNWCVLSGVPHPSFGNWHKAKYAEKIQEVKESITKTNG